MERKTKVIIDVDTGIDDAVALALALNDESLDVKLVTTCAGNNSVENVTYNTLVILEWFERGDVPVAMGAEKPLTRERQQLAVHGGARGMGEYPFDAPKLQPDKLNAVEKMYEVLKAEKRVTIICVAPMTNLAMLLTKHPDAVDYIEQIVFQSGLLTDENYPSFNVTSDPEAVEIVLGHNVPLLICPSDMGHITCLSDDEMEYISNINRTGKMFAKTFESFRDRVCGERVAMHDSCAVACVTRIELFDIAAAKCAIIDDGTKKIFRMEKWGENPNCDVCTHIDVLGFKHYMLETLQRLNKNSKEKK